MTKHDALRKQRIIEYIAVTVRESGYPPSVREIAAAVGEDDLRLAWGRIAAGTSPYQPIGEGAPAPGVPSPARQPVGIDGRRHP